MTNPDPLTEINSFSRALPDLLAGRRTPRDLLEQCLARIEERDGKLYAS